LSTHAPAWEVMTKRLVDDVIPRLAKYVDREVFAPYIKKLDGMLLLSRTERATCVEKAKKMLAAVKPGDIGADVRSSCERVAKEALIACDRSRLAPGRCVPTAFEEMRTAVDILFKFLPAVVKPEWESLIGGVTELTTASKKVNAYLALGENATQRVAADPDANELREVKGVRTVAIAYKTKADTLLEGNVIVADTVLGLCEGAEEDAKIHQSARKEVLSRFAKKQVPSLLDKEHPVPLKHAVYGTCDGSHWWEGLAKDAKIARIKRAWEGTGERFDPDHLENLMDLGQGHLSKLVETESGFGLAPADVGADVRGLLLRGRVTVAEGMMLAVLESGGTSKADLKKQVTDTEDDYFKDGVAENVAVCLRALMKTAKAQTKLNRHDNAAAEEKTADAASTVAKREAVGSNPSTPERAKVAKRVKVA
jgi:hypothetical protein